MIREPEVFLFDEPLSNLDAKLRVQMRIEIRKLHNRLGATSVFVTHDQIEAMTLADRLVVMNAGRAEQVGSPAEIYRKPSSLFVAGFIGSPPMNLIPCEAKGSDTVTIEGHDIITGPHHQGQGTKLVLGIRPEDVTIGTGDFTLSVEFCEELGAARLYHGKLAQETFILQVAGAQGPVPEHIAFSLPQAAIHLFDARSGLRLGD